MNAASDFEDRRLEASNDVVGLEPLLSTSTGISAAGSDFLADDSAIHFEERLKLNVLTMMTELNVKTGRPLMLLLLSGYRTPPTTGCDFP